MANLSNINGKFVVEQTTGYVGVGTTDPNYPIEVLNASAEIALNASGGSIYRVQSDSASNFIIRKEGVGDRLVINSAGNSTFAGEISSGDDINVNNGKLVVNHTSAEVRIKSSSDTGESYINFSDPSDINPGQIYYGHSNNTMVFRVNDIGQMSLSNNLLVFPSTGVHEIRGDRGSGAFAIGNMGDASSQMMVSSRGFLTFNVSNTGSALSATERMRIDSLGNVTIQTSGADDIKNFTINSSNGSSQVAGLIIQNDGANGYINFKAGAGNATPTTKLTIGNAANSGNVGIGTTSPQTKFQVVGAGGFNDGIGFKQASSQEHRIYATTNTQYNTIGSSSPNWIWGQNSGTGTGLSGTSKMKLASNGNLGIGTDSPSQKLQVDGGATGFNQGIPATSGTTQNGMLRLTSGSSVFGETFDFGMNVAPTYAWIQATNKGSLAVNYNLALNPNGGNVGIGTTSPTSQLFVNNTADGDKIRWGRSDALVGSVGTYNGVPYIGYQGGAGGGIMFNGSSIEPTALGSARSSSTNDIGSSSYKWRNIYLSGGAYLGGTGSANLLDDYEEGTFTATMLLDGVGNTATANYTKIGRLVTFTIYYSNVAHTSAGYARISGFPFTAIYGLTGGYPQGSITHSTSILNASGGYLAATTWYATLNNSTSQATWAVGTGKAIMVSGFYYTS